MECVVNKLWFIYEHGFIEIGKTCKVMTLIVCKCLLYVNHYEIYYNIVSFPVDNSS